MIAAQQRGKSLPIQQLSPAPHLSLKRDYFLLHKYHAATFKLSISRQKLYRLFDQTISEEFSKSGG